MKENYKLCQDGYEVMNYSATSPEEAAEYFRKHLSKDKWNQYYMSHVRCEWSYYDLDGNEFDWEIK